jgi:hypothetical protein
MTAHTPEAATALAKLDPQALLTMALERGASMETLERLVALAKEVREVQAVEAFNVAMAEFQARVGPIKKTKTARIQTRGGGSYEYDYADLADVVAEVKPHLAFVGIHHSWRTTSAPGVVLVTCRLTHKLGHFEESGALPMPISAGDESGRGANPAQRLASSVSYGKRYTLQNICGLAPEGEDDDAAGATSEPAGGGGGREDEGPGFAREASGPKPPPSDPIADARRAYISALFEWFSEKKMGSTKRADWLRDKLGADANLATLDPAVLHDVLLAEGVVKE